MSGIVRKFGLNVNNTGLGQSVKVREDMHFSANVRDCQGIWFKCQGILLFCQGIDFFYFTFFDMLIFS